ncbi:hypothetical protein KP509_30G000100 [Ceratopteris richardii]|nr:hypothetical protein KP509_30G000100 [Ceratopteris richardii]
MASSSPSATFLQSMSLDSCKDSRWLVGKSWAGSDLLEDHSGHMQTVLSGEDHGRMTEKSKSFPKNLNVSHMFPLSSSESLASEAFLDYAGVLSPSRAASLEKDLTDLEKETGWKIRVVTKSGRAASVSGKDLKELWKPDEKTVVIIEDISSPNILNFNAGKDVLAKLPRQFFLELQSRYGNKFFVEQEGEGEALVSTVGAIRECLHRPEGCKNVPGLTSDLYFLTLATSIAGGCVFGFAARLPPQGRVEASWQWVLYLSPLWLLLFGAFGILPVVGRTGELEPLIKNVVGFAGAAFALYLTPIFGPSPISRR